MMNQETEMEQIREYEAKRRLQMNGNQAQELLNMARINLALAKELARAKGIDLSAVTDFAGAQTVITGLIDTLKRAPIHPAMAARRQDGPGSVVVTVDATSQEHGRINFTRDIGYQETFNVEIEDVIDADNCFDESKFDSLVSDAFEEADGETDDMTYDYDSERITDSDGMEYDSDTRDRAMNAVREAVFNTFPYVCNECGHRWSSEDEMYDCCDTRPEAEPEDEDGTEISRVHGVHGNH